MLGPVNTSRNRWLDGYQVYENVIRSRAELLLPKKGNNFDQKQSPRINPNGREVLTNNWRETDKSASKQGTNNSYGMFICRLS